MAAGVYARRIATVAGGVALVGYPVAAYFAFVHLSPRRASLVLLAIMAAVVLGRRLARSPSEPGAEPEAEPQAEPEAESAGGEATPLPPTSPGHAMAAAGRPMAFALVVVGALLAASAALARADLALMVPVAINAALLVAFGSTLWRGPPMIERFARLVDHDLRPREIGWCRGWTWAWCGFFIVNAGVALSLALGPSLEAWTTYNSLVSYAMMGVMFAGEYVVRKYRFGRLHPHALDCLLLWIFEALDRTPRSR